MNDRRKYAYATTRKLDTAISDAVGRFMDEHFYSALGERWQRVTELRLQRRGVDVIFGGTKIDEKLKIKGGFANRLLDYPSFELSFVDRRGQRRPGWFLSDDSLTDYYCFIAAFGGFEDENGLTYDALTHLNALFVSKKDVSDYVRERDIDLKHDVGAVVSGMCGECIRHGDAGIHVKLSSSFCERPVNMVTRRDVLRSLPHTREFDVHKEHIEDVDMDNDTTETQGEQQWQGSLQA